MKTFKEALINRIEDPKQRRSLYELRDLLEKKEKKEEKKLEVVTR